jgi:hypothetical protein
MEETGRKFRRNWSAQWDATNVSDFVAEKILNIDDIGTDYSSARYAIEHVEWSSNATIGASIYFDGIADGGDVLEITDGATAGEVDFKNFPSGVAQDSDNTGNNLVIDTINAANGDKITLTIIGRVKGKRQP